MSGTVSTTLLTVAVFLLGLLAFDRLGVAPLPEADFPTIQVSATLPGASPETMASSVATPLEAAPLEFAQRTLRPVDWTPGKHVAAGASEK